MWCPTCQQDVPIVTGMAVNTGRCPRCLSQLSIPQHDPQCPVSATPLDCGIELDAEAVSARPPIDLNEWAVTERLKRIERLLARQQVTELGLQRSDLPQHRVDVAHRIETTMVRRKTAGTSSGRRASGRSIPGLWLALFFALVGSMVWLVGMAASLAVPVARPLTEAGLPIPLQMAGICFLLVGTGIAVVQSSIFSRRIVRRLDSLETVAHDLRTTVRRATATESRI